jgi:hypothetical protein
VVRSTGQYPAPPSAVLAAGHRARQDGLTDFASPFSSAGHSTSETIRRPPPLHVQNGSGHHLHARNHQRGQGLPGVVDLYQSDFDRLSLALVLGATHPSLLPSLPTNNDAAPVSRTREYRGSEPTLSGPEHHPRQPIRRAQPPVIVQSDIVSSGEAPQAARAMFDRRSFLVNDLQYPNQAVNAPRFVAHNEADPGKRRKRTDRVEDKRRKEDISRWHGACFGCRNARKRCDGREVCDRCRRLSSECLRTCSLCRANKLVCDDVVPCQHCRISKAECVRPSTENTTTPHSHQRHNLPPASPFLQAEPPRSSAHLKSHTMLETRSDLDGPASWRFGFEVKHDTQQGNKRRYSQSLQIGPPRSPLTRRRVSADLPSDESARGVNSDSAYVGSRRFSQQGTDVDLHLSFTQGSTAAVSEKDSLKVPDEEDLEAESCSGATEYSHFEEALWDGYRN